MKAKIIGFKVGKPRPTFNKTIDFNEASAMDLGEEIYTALDRSDFLSVRWIEDEG